MEMKKNIQFNLLNTFLWIVGLQDSSDIHQCGIGAGANLGSKVVQTVKTVVVCLFLIKLPRIQDEQRATCAGFETMAFGLPELTNGLFLQLDDGKALINGSVYHKAFSFRDTWRHEHNALAGFVELAFARLSVAFGLFGREACVLVATMIEHLFLLGALQQEKGSKGGKIVGADAQMQAALHQVGQLLPNHGAQRIVSHITLDILEHAWASDDAVVVAALKERWARRGRSRGGDRS